MVITIPEDFSSDASTLMDDNPKKMELERLDDGTSDIDSLDAMEYSFEKRIKKFIKKTG